jgi:hypothetical protein
MDERLLPMDIESSKFSLVRNKFIISHSTPIYRGADNSLTRPGTKQATATEEFEFHISYL